MSYFIHLFFLFISFQLAGCTAKDSFSKNSFNNSSSLIVNVKDFGAKGDGVSNDYKAFYLSVNKINSARGGTLVIPKGHYLLDEYSDQNKNMDLVFSDLKFLKIEGNG